MLRKAFVMPVNPDCHQEYQRRHSPIWPELAAVLKQHGVHSYSIWLDPQRNLLFAQLEVESEQRWAEIAKTEVCQRWWASMVQLMPSNADNSPISSDLQLVFELE